MWFLEICTTNKEGKIEKHMEKVREEFPLKSLNINTSIIVLEGDDVKEHPSKNCVMSNPSTPSSARMDIELVHRI